MQMSAVADSLEARVMRTLEEVVKERSPGGRHVDTSMVLERMRLGERRDELAACLAELIDKGDIDGKKLLGDDKITRITEQGLQRLEDE